jgi:hypothetical protein
MRRTPVPHHARSLLVSFAAFIAVNASFAQTSAILGGDLGTPDKPLFDLNVLLGAGRIYDAGYFGVSSVIGNVEAGHVWKDHEVFGMAIDEAGDLTLQSGIKVAKFVDAAHAAALDTPEAPANPSENALGSLDLHATAVGHVLAGLGFFAHQYGIAYGSTLWSGAIATSFGTDGSFETDFASLRVPYESFFTGNRTGLTQAADVINSSWGDSDDKAGTSAATLLTDALAAANPLTTFVVSAGNGGPTTGTVGGPGTGYNGITVGALGGSDEPSPYNRPSDFTSRGPMDFYNPETDTTVIGVRAAVTIAAPGEDFAVAYYGGSEGSAPDPIESELPTDFYIIGAAGTSFSAPLVSSGVALLKDVAHNHEALSANVNARDTRVMKAVLMASAHRTQGWDNGQHLEGDVVRTTQSLDWAVGAGRMDLSHAFDVLTGVTTDVAGLGGGQIGNQGWDYASVALGEANSYTFFDALPADVRLTIALTWFIERAFDDSIADETSLSEVAFANLDLQIWLLGEGDVFLTLVAESSSLYNNVEFLSYDLVTGGHYGVKVLFDDVIYDLTDLHTVETYGLAWSVTAIPEPAAAAGWIAFSGLLLACHRRTRRR